MRICTLIPTYKKEFFISTLIALGSQTLKPNKVIFSDDSLDSFLINDLNLKESVSKLLPEAELIYIRGPKIGALTNIKFLLSQADDQDDLIHILFDDDLIFPDFYLTHRAAHSQFNSIHCTVSFRWFISESNIPIGTLTIPASVRYGERYQSISLPALSQSTVPHIHNWLGELSNATFRGLPSASRIFDVCDTAMPMCGLEDIGTFAKFAEEGSLLLIAEFLGGFRVSQFNNTANKGSDNFKAAVLGWIPLSLFALARNCITLDQHWETVRKVLTVSKGLYTKTDPALIRELEEYFLSRVTRDLAFLTFWHSYLETASDYQKAYKLNLVR